MLVLSLCPEFESVGHNKTENLIVTVLKVAVVCALLRHSPNVIFAGQPVTANSRIAKLMAGIFYKGY